MDEAALREMAERLVRVDGIVGVVLGGSRARGEHRADSDFDLGLYYERPLDTEALSRLARKLAGDGAEVTAPGAWGPWVDGGGWLSVDGHPVDWLYRELSRVEGAVGQAKAGRFAFHAQVGHPLGVPDFAYAGEIALAVVLADPSGVLERLHRAASTYPPLLRDAVVGMLGEARFLTLVASKVVARGDSTYVAGCLFRAVSICAHALHASAGRWLINEKGCVDAAGGLVLAPVGFADRAHAVLAGVGRSIGDLESAIAKVTELVEATQKACDSAEREASAER